MRALAAAAAIGLITSALVAGCSQERPPRIPDSDDFGGASIPNWPANTPWNLLGAVALCIDKPGSIQVTGVELEHSSGLRLDAFALRPVDWTGEEYPQQRTFQESLWELGFEPEIRAVDTVCPDDSERSEIDSEDPPMELGLQFSKPTDDTARGAVIKLTYESRGESFVHRIGFELVLCETSEQAEECQPGDPADYGWD